MRFFVSFTALWLVGAPVQATPLSCPADRHLADIEPNGVVSAGSLDALRAAYRRGNSLRVGRQLDWDNDENVAITHWADTAFMSEFEGMLFAQLAEIEQQIPQPGSARIEFPAESHRRRGLLSTDGLLIGRYSGAKPLQWRVRSSWCLAAAPDRLACEVR